MLSIYLSPAELATLGEALSLAEQEGVEDPYAIAAIRLLIFTGWRLNEIMTLKWGNVDFKGRCLRLPDSTSTLAPRRSTCSPGLSAGPTIPGHLRQDAGRPKNRPAAALAAMPRAGYGMASGPRAGTAAADLVHGLEHELGREATYEECLAATEEHHLHLPTGLMDVLIHDLRHSFASLML